MIPRGSAADRCVADGYRFVRRLAAIAYIDVVGYSRHMGLDEEATVARWLAIRRDLFEPRAAAHRGRVVNAVGDSAVLEFSSVLDAVAWSRDVQAVLRAANAVEGSAQPKIAVRIAVHLCEVIDESADIFGDGVNIAARLQAYAPPGGVIVSETAHDVLRVSIELETKDLGPLFLKNIADPVRGYLLDPVRNADAVSASTDHEPLPSIAVLPLRDISSASNNYFGDGMVEDIIVSLAGLRELLVIARESTLAYGAQSNPVDVGQTLGARYVVSGTVRRSRESFNVIVTLNDVREQSSIWSANYSASLGDFFDVQEEIVGQIVADIAPNVRAAELRRSMRKRPENFSAYDLTLRALESIHSLDRATFQHARDYLERATAIDPTFAMARAWLARWHSLSVGQGWSERPSDYAEKGLALAAKALDSDPNNALALATFGHLRAFLFHDYVTATDYLARARAACPSSAIAWTLSSATASYTGRFDEAIAFAERGLRLSPQDRSLFCSYFFIGLAYYSAGHFQEAVRWCRLSHSENPFYTANLRILAAALAAASETVHCRGVVRSLLSLEPAFRITDYAKTRQPFGASNIREAYLEHLHAAGFPC